MNKRHEKKNIVNINQFHIRVKEFKKKHIYPFNKNLLNFSLSGSKTLLTGKWNFFDNFRLMEPDTE